MNRLTYLIIFLLLLTTVSAGKVDYILSWSCATDSMIDTIKCGDRIIVNTVSRGEVLEFGNIYCYNYDKRGFGYSHRGYVCHTLDWCDEEHCIFKSDTYGYDIFAVEIKNIALKVINIEKS